MFCYLFSFFLSNFYIFLPGLMLLVASHRLRFLVSAHRLLCV